MIASAGRRTRRNAAPRRMPPLRTARSLSIVHGMRLRLACSLLALASLSLGDALAAERLVEFVESGGCRLLVTEQSVTRLNEIASQGNVTWEGRCVGGRIEGLGVLRHEGSVVENGRTRKYAFYLSGTAHGGSRMAIWNRETFNMFADSSRYWTSLATITYVDGAARGSPKLLPVRDNNDFSPSFRKMLAQVDLQLAQGSRPAAEPALSSRPPPGGQPDSTVDKAAPNDIVRPAPPPRAETSQAAPPQSATAPQLAAAAAAGATSVPTRPAAVAENASVAAPSPAPQPSPASQRSPSSQPSPAAQSPAPRQVAPFVGGLDSSGGFGLRAAPGSPGLKGPAVAKAAPAQPRIAEQVEGCYLDLINGELAHTGRIVATAGQPLRVAGWAVDLRAKSVPARAWVQVSSPRVSPGVVTEIARNTDRPDVAKSLGDAVFGSAGFDITLATEKLPAGDYSVVILQHVGDEILVCRSMGQVSLRQGPATPARPPVKPPPR